MTTSKVLFLLKKNEKELRNQYNIKSMYLFGSYARGEANTKSDIDIIVEFSVPSTSLFDFLRTKNFLEEILGRKVDLVCRDSIRDWMRAAVERDSIRAA